LDEEDIHAVRRGGILHDIGNLTVDDQIILKPGPLSAEEYKIVKKHSEEGEKICKPMKKLEKVLPVIRHHHERYDGSGYPDGLQGGQIPITAQVIALADSFDVLTSIRPFRSAYSKEEALSVLNQEMVTGKWDRNLYNEFRKMLKENNIEYFINREVPEARGFGGNF